MANMSYCRFENTVSDMEDCFSSIMAAIDERVAMDEFREGLSSDYERRAFDRFIDMMREGFIEIESWADR